MASANGKIKPGKTVGIDLGTTRSCVAHIDNGKAVVIPNADSELVTPSVVLFDEGGTILVGREAKAQAVASGTRVVRESKRDIGRTDAQWEIDGKTYKPEAIGALILMKLKKDAEERLGEPIVNAVITVPAYFNDSQRAATEAAGIAAGLNVIDILNEPVAAALAYGIDRGGDEGHIVVYDLGGGTFDVSVMKVEKGSLTMVATDGNVELGGKDWDQRIIDLVREEFRTTHGSDPCEDLDVAQALKNDAEAAKEVLSRKDNTKIICQYEGKKLVVPLTRKQFDEATEELLSQTENTLSIVVEDKAGIGWDQIKKVLLVGGSSKMPQVQEMVRECTGKDTNMGDVEPDLCVALGAAYRAFMLEAQAAEAGTLDPTKAKEVQEVLAALPPAQRQAIGKKVTNVTSHSYGVETVREFRGNEPILMNTIMIEANSPLPVQRTQTFGTAYPNQTSVEVRVLEGESEDTAFCEEAGKGTIPDIPPLPQGAPITITLDFTDRGIIEVRARDDTHGKELRMTLERQTGMTAEELKAMTGLLAKADVQ